MYYYHRLRIIFIIKLATKYLLRLLSSDIEVDESYFGGRCKGKRERGTEKNALYLGFSSVKVRFIQRLYLVLRPAI